MKSKWPLFCRSWWSDAIGVDLHASKDRLSEHPIFHSWRLQFSTNLNLCNDDVWKKLQPCFPYIAENSILTYLNRSHVNDSLPQTACWNSQMVSNPEKPLETIAILLARALTGNSDTKDHCAMCGLVASTKFGDAR